MSQETSYGILLTSATSSLEHFTLAPSYLHVPHQRIAIIILFIFLAARHIVD